MENPKGIAAIPILIVAIVVAALLAGGSWWYGRDSKCRGDKQCAVQPVITNFNDCVNIGYPATLTYPRQCTAYGVTYTEVVTNGNQNTNVATNTNSNNTVSNPDELVRQRECAQSGGQWQTNDPPVTPFGSGYCISTYADGGKLCNDDDQCIGQCVASLESSGACATNSLQIAECGSYHFPKGVKTREGSCP